MLKITPTIITGFTLVILLLTSCMSNNSFTPKNENEKLAINGIDTIFLISSDIVDYLPEKLRKHEDIIEYFKNYLKVGDEFYLHSHVNLDAIANLQMDVVDAEKSSNEGNDIIIMSKSTFKAFKSVVKSSGSAFNTAWSAMDLLEIERKRNELQGKYSTKTIDDFIFVEKAINKYLYYSYVDPFQNEMKKIENHSSIRTLAKSITQEQYEELGVKSKLEKLIKLQSAGNEIRKILIFNKMIGRISAILVLQEVNRIKSFWKSNASENANSIGLFNSFSNILIELKTNLTEDRKYIQANREDWSQSTISDLEKVISGYENAVAIEIDDLLINEKPQPNWTLFKDAKYH